MKVKCKNNDKIEELETDKLPDIQAIQFEECAKFSAACDKYGFWCVAFVSNSNDGFRTHFGNYDQNTPDYVIDSVARSMNEFLLKFSQGKYHVTGLESE